MPDPQNVTLTVLGGPLAGQVHVVDMAADEVLIGSDPECAFSLDLPTVSPIHARLWVDRDGVLVRNTRAPRGVFVNDAAVEDEAPLRDGDVLWLGPPGDDGSVMIQVRVPPPPEAASGAAWEDAAPVPEVWGGDGDVVPEEAVPTAGGGESDEWAEAAEVAPSEEATFPPLAPEGESAEWGAAAPAVEAAADTWAAPAEDDAPVEVMASAEEAFPVVEPDAEEASAPMVMEEEAPVMADSFALEETPSAASFGLAEPEMAAPVAMEEPAAEPAAASFALEESESPLPAGDFAVEEPEPPAADAFVLDEPAADSLAMDAPAAAFAAFEAPAEEAFAAPALEEPPARPAPPPPPPPPAPEAAPPKPAPAPRPAPKAAAPKSAPTPRPAAAPAPSAPPPAVASGPSPALKYGAVAVVALLVLGGGGFFAHRAMTAPKLTGVSPARVPVGGKVTLSGENFGATPEANAVQFGGSPAKIVQAAATSIVVEAPKAGTSLGADTPMSITVTVEGRVTEAQSVAVYVPTLASAVAPGAAMPGDEVVVTGMGFGPGAKVKFGTAEGTVVDVKPEAIKVKVPAMDGSPGTPIPLTVTSGKETTAPVPFRIGRLPLVLSVEPASAAPGTLVKVKGLGLGTQPALVRVEIAGRPALVTAAADVAVDVLVPLVDAADGAALRLTVPGSDAVGEGVVSVSAPASEVAFSAERVVDDPAHDHALVTGPGGAFFVLSASGGKVAATRGADAVKALSEAADALRAGTPAEAVGAVVSVAGKPIAEATAEDAAAYAEPWVAAPAKGDPPSVARLAIWWAATLTDRMTLVRGEKPARAAALAPEGKALADLGAAAAKSGWKAALAGAKPAQKDALRTLAFRLPAAIKEPVVPGAPPPPTTPGPPPLKLVGTWYGSHMMDRQAQNIEIEFKGSGGTFTLMSGAIPVTVPLLGVQVQKSTGKFRVDIKGGTSFYTGQWDGTKLTGTISSDATGKKVLGTFELSPTQ